MNNEETLQEYNTRLTENNTSLNNILSMINELPEGGSSSTDNFGVYSTEEIVVGRWLDGKPIYKKTITIQIDGASDITNAPHNISNLDNVIRYEAFFKEGTTTRYMPQFYNDMSPTYAINVYLIGSELVQVVYGQWAKNIKPLIYTTLYYTKTTD